MKPEIRRSLRNALIVTVRDCDRMVSQLVLLWEHRGPEEGGRDHLVTGLPPWCRRVLHRADPVKVKPPAGGTKTRSTKAGNTKTRIRSAKRIKTPMRCGKPLPRRFFAAWGRKKTGGSVASSRHRDRKNQVSCKLLLALMSRFTTLGASISSKRGSMSSGLNPLWIMQALQMHT